MSRSDSPAYAPSISYSSSSRGRAGWRSRVWASCCGRVDLLPLSRASGRELFREILHGLITRTTHAPATDGRRSSVRSTSALPSWRRMCVIPSRYGSRRSSRTRASNPRSRRAIPLDLWMSGVLCFDYIHCVPKLALLLRGGWLPHYRKRRNQHGDGRHLAQRASLE